MQPFHYLHSIFSDWLTLYYNVTRPVLFNYALMGGVPEAYRVSESLHKITVCISLQSLKIRTKKSNASLNILQYYNRISNFWISCFVCCWANSFTLMTVASNLESSKEHKIRLLISMTVQSEQQIRQWPKCIYMSQIVTFQTSALANMHFEIQWARGRNPENKNTKATQPNFGHTMDHMQ